MGVSAVKSSPWAALSPPPGRRRLPHCLLECSAGGRFVSRDQAAIERYVNVTTHQFRLFDRYNIAPTTTVPVVRILDDERTLSGMHWGLIPPWTKDRKIGYKTFNARAETVATKPAFRAAYKARRCVIPATGFYEWKRDVEPKQPYFIHRQDESPIGFAAMGDAGRWRRTDRELHHHHHERERDDGRAARCQEC